MNTTNICTKKLSVEIDHNLTWENKVGKVGNIPKSYDVWKVGNLYPTSKGKETVDLVLVNFPDGGSWQEAQEYAKEHNLFPTTPFDVFSIETDLKKETNQEYGYVIETTGCTFAGLEQACSVWWHGSGREASLGWQSRCGYSRGWFAFRKSSNLNLSSLSDPLSLDLPNVHKKLDILLNHFGLTPNT